MEYSPDEIPYKSPPLAPSAQRHFLPGPGEGLPFQSISLHLEGVIRIEGHLLTYVVHVSIYIKQRANIEYSVSPRTDYILFSTRSPPAIQRIPWPQLGEDEVASTRPVSRDFKYYDTWVLNDADLPWLIDSDGTA